MDRNDALRIVIWEYLIPEQRKRRMAQLSRQFAAAGIDETWAPDWHLEDIFEELLLLSDRLLHSQGFSTSYVYPISMRHQDSRINNRRIVCALVDSEGPFVWNATCTRPADPFGG